MRFRKQTLLKNIAPALFILASYVAAAQQHRVFTFQQGDEFEKQIHMNSTCSIQRGKQVLNISSSSVISRSYQVTAVSDSAYQFSITIKKMDDLINFQGKRLHFNSDNAIDTSSQIHKVLKYMMVKPSYVSVNKRGIILSAIDANTDMSTDTLVAFAGLPEQNLTKGGRFDLIADLSSSKVLKKGYSWTVSSSVKDQKMTTDFVIDNITDAITIVKFKNSIKGQYLNSNSNGTYVLDNKSGIVIQRLVESVSTGYQLKNHVLYATTRKISLAEDCVKVGTANASLKP
jgi:hypothetical protein